MKKNNLQLYFAAAVLILIIGASILAPLLVTHNPFEPDMASRLQPPSWQHFFGTDALGRDMFSRILYGGRASILLSLTAALLSLGAGLLVGLFCGFYGGKLDIFFTIVSNIFQGIPGSCFMIAIAGIFGASIKSLVLALVITSWAGFSRIVRAEVLQLKEQIYIKTARKLGKSNLYIVMKHMVPHLLPQFIVGLVLLFPHAILHESSITFLGFGLSNEQPAIGIILSEAMKYLITGKWWLALFPGIMLVITVVCFYTTGENLRRLLDPASAHE